ncbi:MAG TPA: hypothetical protein VGH74_11510, partial [Planctomycetaceae bacterium]
AAILGGWLAETAEAGAAVWTSADALQPVAWTSADALKIVFFLSFAGRLASLVLLARVTEPGALPVLRLVRAVGARFRRAGAAVIGRGDCVNPERPRPPTEQAA